MRRPKSPSGGAPHRRRRHHQSHGTAAASTSMMFTPESCCGYSFSCCCSSLRVRSMTGSRLPAWRRTGRPPPLAAGPLTPCACATHARDLLSCLRCLPLRAICWLRHCCRHELVASLCRLSMRHKARHVLGVQGAQDRTQRQYAGGGTAPAGCQPRRASRLASQAFFAGSNIASCHTSTCDAPHPPAYGSCQPYGGFEAGVVLRRGRRAWADHSGTGERASGSC